MILGHDYAEVKLEPSHKLTARLDPNNTLSLSLIYERSQEMPYEALASVSEGWYFETNYFDSFPQVG